MRLTHRLLGYLNRVFNKDPVKFLALRLNYSGTAMTWAVTDGVLTTTVTGGPGQALTVLLKNYTLSQLASYLAAQPGYSVPYQPQAEFSPLSATTLLDGSGNPANSNGDHLNGYTSPLWAILESCAVQLDDAKKAVYEMLKQMTTPTAEAEWLDEIGGHYAVLRQDAEADNAYGPRIIAEIVRPRGNNKAMEIAIRKGSGCYSARVTDAPAQMQGNGRLSYGLFDIEAIEDVNNPLANFDTFVKVVLDMVANFRDAGTHLRHARLGLTVEGRINIGMATVGGVSSTIFPPIEPLQESPCLVGFGSAIQCAVYSTIYPG